LMTAIGFFSGLVVINRMSIIAISILGFVVIIVID